MLHIYRLYIYLHYISNIVLYVKFDIATSRNSLKGKHKATTIKWNRSESFPQADRFSKNAVRQIKPYGVTSSAAGYLCQFLWKNLQRHSFFTAGRYPAIYDVKKTTKTDDFTFEI